MNNNETGKQKSVCQLEDQLFSVLSRHYYVNGQTFNQISAINMAKHEICHLTKAAQKIQRACNKQDEEAIQVVLTELMPDLIIYALEVALSFDVQWWRSYELSSVADSDELLGYMTDNLGANYSLEKEMLRNVRSNLILAISRFGHYCDKYDHKQESGVSLDTEVILPFFVAACSISKFYSAPLASHYRQRLIFVENKYVGQPDYHITTASKS